MILLLFAVIVFFFLWIGSLVFLCLIILPHTRDHALSAALWCAAWGPCIIVLLILAGFGFVTGTPTHPSTQAQRLEQLLSGLEPAYAVLGVPGTVVIASMTAWLHQMLIHRMTLALFRVYASFVTAGIGSVLGCALGFWMLANAPGHVLFWLANIFLLSISFGYAGFRWGPHLRGNFPENFTWITPEEFEGPSNPAAVQ